ncbi:MAG TPA: hypothetical protein VMS17_29805 [Gemmataceae bacterium]|nr:hypothetical protein [Gemmataceae bacterium]
MGCIPHVLRPIVLVCSAVGAWSGDHAPTATATADPAPSADLAATASAGPLLPCGVADPGGRTGFLANAHGGVDAVDLATGDLLWDVDGAKRPALADDERLYAWTPVNGNGLRVVGFDRAKGGRPLLQTETAVFPDWVSVEDGPGRSFATRWRLDKGRLILDWEARAWYSGPHATPQAEADARRHAAGRVLIDIESGKIEMRAAQDRAPSAALPPPKDLEKAVVRWQGPAGEGQAALVLDDAGGRQRLSLWSWNGGNVDGPKELLTGRRLAALPTIDERFLCLRDAATNPDQGAAPEDRDGWSIFAVDGGERLAQAPYEAGTECIALIDQRAFFLVAGPFKGRIDRPFIRPRRLEAFDLRAGKSLWERPVEGKLCSPP